MPKAAMPIGAKKTLHENLKDSCEEKDVHGRPLPYIVLGL